MFIFGGLRSIALKTEDSTIDNVIFKLHYRLTMLILIAAALLVTSQEYFGKPISCGPAPAGLPGDILDNFCWTRSTFTVLDFGVKQVGSEVAYRGVEQANPGSKRIYQSYYQWVWIMLFIQAIAFYFPRFLWRKGEGNKIGTLSSNLTQPGVIHIAQQERLKYVVSYVTRVWHRLDFWAARFFACELLNFVNVIGQIFAINKFLGGAFTEFGPKVIEYSSMEPEERTDPMVMVFPRLAKCTFHTFGPSGDVQTHDALCVLPLNIVNEKIYVLLWFWLIILAIPTGLMLIYRALLIALPSLRLAVLRYRFRFVDRSQLERVVEKTSIGDWLLISLLGKNLDTAVFEQIVAELDAKFHQSPDRKVDA